LRRPGPARTPRTAPAIPPFPPGGLTAGGRLRLARPEILPLSTGHDLDAPLRALAGAAAGLGDGEHAVWQVLARPVTGARLRRARRAARRHRTGRRAPLALRLAARLLAAAVSRRRRRRGRAAPRPDPELSAEARAATDKLASPQWETVIRYGLVVTRPRGSGRDRAPGSPGRGPGPAAGPSARPGRPRRPVRGPELAGPASPAPTRPG